MAENPQVRIAESTVCGGVSEARQVDDRSKALFEEFHDIIQQKLQAQFQIPQDFKIEPAKVRTQIVSGTNYYFHVLLPNGEFAHVKIFRPIQGHALAGGDLASFVTVNPKTTLD